MDLAVSQPVLITDTKVQLLPTGVWGPLGGGHSALLLGRSSVTRMGLFVLPGVIDSDFVGEIQIMAWTPSPPCYIKKGEKIAQLVLFKVSGPKGRGGRFGGFGSTNVPQIMWAHQITQNSRL